MESLLRSNFPKPCILLMDAIEQYPVLSALFEEYCNISVNFYPPPSPEERFVSDLTNPMTVHPTCEICRSKLAENGMKLLTCSRCKNAYYCCAAHQKQDWKRHRNICSPTNL